MQDRLREKVQLLIEQRVIEATKKQVTRKLLDIARWLGRPIIAQTLFSNYDENWRRQEEDMIYEPMKFSEDRTYESGEFETSERGLYFDGLRCGINLCITAMLYDNKLEELKATYNGYLVFAEIEGELKAYAPFPAWENSIDMFYEAALQIEKKKTAEMKIQRQEKSRENMQNFWAKIKNLWGY